MLATPAPLPVPVDVSALGWLDTAAGHITSVVAILGAAGVAWRFVWQRVLRQRWRRSAFFERRLLARLADTRTRTDVEVRELLGRPLAHRQLYLGMSPDEVLPEKADRLTSWFYVLAHVYVDVLFDSSQQVYGYSVVRRNGDLGPINVSGLTVHLGRTTWADAWDSVSPTRPARVYWPHNRNYAGVEASEGSGVAYRGRTWAVGTIDAGGESEGSNAATQAMFRDVSEFEDLTCVPEGWFTSPEVTAWRTVLPINMAAVAIQGEMRRELLDLHTDELVVFDPPG